MSKDIIETKRLKLRPLTLSDSKDIAKAANNKEIYDKTLTIPYPYRLADAKSWLRSLKGADDKAVFGIELDGQIVGVVSLNGIKEKHMAEIGYWLAEEHWGKGIISEAVEALVEYGFDELDLVRIYGKAFLFNPASGKVMEKCGFKKGGTLKKEAQKEDKFLDCNIYAITK
jgi:RimJ/RimL family protein N-acetyltransferase